MRRRTFLTSSIGVLGGDWTQFRGPARAGISAEKGLLKSWPKGGPKLLWQQPDIGDGYGTVAVLGKFLYAISNHGMDDEFVLAMAVSNGEPVWSTRLGQVGNPNQQPPYPMARSTPSIDGDRLYAFSSDGILACLLMAELVATEGKSLGRILKGLEKKTGEFHTDRINVKIPAERKEALLQRLGRGLEKVGPFKVEKFITTDGYKFLLPNREWVAFRASGTEPMIRCYIEAKSPAQMKKLRSACQAILTA